MPQDDPEANISRHHVRLLVEDVGHYPGNAFARKELRASLENVGVSTVEFHQFKLFLDQLLDDELPRFLRSRKDAPAEPAKPSQPAEVRLSSPRNWPCSMRPCMW